MLITACCSSRALLYSKMLKETKTEEAIDCVVIMFIIGGTSVGEPRPIDYAYGRACSLCLNVVES